MLFATTWMDLTKWRKSDTERQIPYHLNVEFKRTVWMNLFIKQSVRDIESKLMVTKG